jgi:uncharacterized protein GlcG (DUF336 family)
MSWTMKTLCGAVFFAAVLPAQAQPVMEKNITQAMVLTAFQGAVAECRKSNSNTISVVIVNREGLPVLLARGDNASPHNLDLAKRKAYTARTFRMTSLAWRDRTKADQPNAPQRQLAEVIALGGGVPIMIGDDAIGGIGVSGSNGGQAGDEACAKGGIAAIADQLH